MSVYFEHFLKITRVAQSCGLLLWKVHTRNALIMTKNVLGHILGYFFTDSSGHPGKFAQSGRSSRLKLAGGRCYDHNFLRFWPIFGEKIGVFSKTNVMIKNFA
jgi:hypothetical protein